MKRKIIKLGTATLVVSLPSKWAKKFNLNAGNELELIEEDKNLIIQTGEKVAVKKEITVDITDENKKDIKNILTHVYRKGFQRIVINGINADLFNEIKNIVNDLLLGFEITHKERDSCVLENLAEPTEQKYNVLLRRVFLIIKETQNTIISDFESNRLNFKEIEDLRRQHDKFVLFCRRIITKEPEKKIIFEWELLTFLMHIEHAYYYLYKYMYDNKMKVDSDAINLLKESKNYFELLYHAYFEKDIKSIHKINNLKKEFHFGKIISFIENKKGKNAVVFSYLREIFRLVQIGSSPVLSIILA